MTARAITQLLQSAPATALPGTWKLARGRAITLHPTSDGILRIAHGRVWATVEGPHGVSPADSGDHVLEVGRSMYLRAGQRVVIEAWNCSGASYFAWDPVFAPAPAPAAVRPAFCMALVVQPLADLRMALGMGLRAAGQLASGVARLAWEVLRSGHRAFPGRRAHGATG
ncbi:DUF2917 domain-containing protein [Ramlibacter pallidus]|uniref:DUF2917 domain-containing protein n=1 Tax=Ramlibacter pallidus TaxID=2780087 RepID=A0ABR9RZY5_9BURK|nr:DUF2917 domain-containing protein [Ramlibacter pallidus]MBE7366394.1 DUF2917 domain-containing protein [Ramlibacter pallidus]